MQETQGSVAVRFIESCLADSFYPVPVQPHESGWMISAGTTKGDLPVVDDDKKQGRGPPSEPGLPSHPEIGDWWW